MRIYYVLSYAYTNIRIYKLYILMLQKWVITIILLNKNSSLAITYLVDNLNNKCYGLGLLASDY